MKKLISDIQITESIRKFSPQMGGVFSTADLHNLIGTGSKLTNQRAIARIEDSGLLTRCQRGFYVTRDFNLWLLAARIEKNGYVSMDSVLSANGLIGTVTTNRVSVVTSRPAKSLKTGNKRIDFYQINNALYFGFTLKKGVPTADNEKAFLDLLYYHLRGYRFAIDPKTEINTSLLDRKKIEVYIKKYKNPKFVAFVRGIIYGK